MACRESPPLADLAMSRLLWLRLVLPGLSLLALTLAGAGQAATPPARAGG